MKWRNLLILASLCLLPTACADGMAEGDLPPITEVEPPAVQPVPENPIPSPAPTDDGDDDGPHYFPAGDIQIQKVPTYELAPAPLQAHPCVIDPENCEDE